MFLNPYLGYVKATEVAKGAYRKKSVVEIVRAQFLTKSSSNRQFNHSKASFRSFFKAHFLS